ncbi:MAG TPA: PEGA domain-containing protein, partial [Kofleriaceae bacterium]|nr:PEGA domain-containing protein [Kofleriaceae bacterium]
EAPAPRRPSAGPRPAPARPRQPHEETRPAITPAPPDPSNTEDSGLLHPDGNKVDLATWDRTGTIPGVDDGDLENIGERTVVTGGTGRGFMMDVATEDGIDATMVSAGPPQPDEPGEDDVTNAGAGDDSDDGPTVQRDAPRIPTGKTPPPALAAKIHAPAVSELRKPRPSRRTAPGGVPHGNVLQQIVGAQASEPMPVPRAAPASNPTPPSMPTVPILAPPLPAPPTGPTPVAHPTPPSQFPAATPGGQAHYIHDASGLPMVVPTPPGTPAAQGGPGYGQGQAQPQPFPGAPPGSPPGVPPGYPPQPYAPGQPPYPVSPGGLYQFSPYGQPQPMPMTLTGQLRLSEADEIPSHFKIQSGRRRWLAYIVAGLIAVSVAAGSTFFIIRATREEAPVSGSVRIESVPDGGEVYFNGRSAGKTPFTLKDIPVGTRHDIRIELPRHQAYLESVHIPQTGGEVTVSAVMKPLTGKIIVNSQPGEAEIWINGQLRGRTPTTVHDVDMGTARRLELRLKGYQRFVADLEWPASGQISLDAKLQR